MPRIRSTHPGQWTDEAFVSRSPLARLLAIALRNEADDGGVFEWKPLQIKMRLLPVDNCDAAALLAELEEADLVRGFEHGGRRFGAIRNFLRFQRPKKPSRFYPRPESLDAYVGLGSEPGDDEGGSGSGPGGSQGPLGGEAVPNSGPIKRAEVPRKAVPDPQRKEEGGSMEEESEEAKPKPPAGAPDSRATAGPAPASPDGRASPEADPDVARLAASVGDRLGPAAADEVRRSVAAWDALLDPRHVRTLIRQALSGAGVRDPVRWTGRLVRACAAEIARGELPARLGPAPEPARVPAEPSTPIAESMLPLAREIGEAPFRVWIEPLILERRGAELVATAPSRTHRDWVRVHYADPLLRHVGGSRLVMELVS